jgi:hypothetical protein
MSGKPFIKGRLLPLQNCNKSDAILFVLYALMITIVGLFLIGFVIFVFILYAEQICDGNISP